MLKYRRNRQKELSGVEVLSKAQQIAFAPFTFQCVGALIDLGILEFIDKNPADIDEIIQNCNVTEYCIKVLFDAAILSGFVKEKNGKYSTTKLSQAFLYNEMTRVNFNFMRDVCYTGASELLNSLKKSSPEGLKKFVGNYPTIYPALTSLPEKMKKSWYEFDHFYSDRCFDEVLNIIFKDNPENIFDIGGNTGKFERACLEYNDKCKLTMLDLEENIGTAKKNINSPRCNYVSINVIDKNAVYPKFSNVVFMSQFLDCFSPEQIEFILKNIRENIEKSTKIYILEPFIDNQQFKGAAYSLAHISLYFTCMANGNSKMYKKSDMEKFIDNAGLKIVNEYRINPHDYTLLECEIK